MRPLKHLPQKVLKTVVIIAQIDKHVSAPGTFLISSVTSTYPKSRLCDL
jgi:hypothetical protein